MKFLKIFSIIEKVFITTYLVALPVDTLSKFLDGDNKMALIIGFVQTHGVQNGENKATLESRWVKEELINLYGLVIQTPQNNYINL